MDIENFSPVRIGAGQWTVSTEDDMDHLGLCNTKEKKITIDAGIKSPSVEVNVFLHEIFHALFYEWLPDDFLKEKKEEFLVDQLAKGTLAMFQDNPELLGKWKKLIERSLEH